MRPLRSLLFVPGDRPERFAKALASRADAVIFDLEDSVVPARKVMARQAVAEQLARERTALAFVRVNPLGGEAIVADLAILRAAGADGLVLPKAEGAASLTALAALYGTDLPPILPIATETPAAIFELGAYRTYAGRLAGLTWGAEDLPAACGATASREPNGRYTPPYELVRSLALFAAHAAGAPAIETVFPTLSDRAGLAAYVVRARRDGFSGMLALHPAQVGTINAGFSPSSAEVAAAQRIVDAFSAQPAAGVIALDGKMVDRPHLVQAQRILALATF